MTDRRAFLARLTAGVAALVLPARAYASRSGGGVPSVAEPPVAAPDRWSGHGDFWAWDRTVYHVDHSVTNEMRFIPIRRVADRPLIIQGNEAWPDEWPKHWPRPTMRHGNIKAYEAAERSIEEGIAHAR